MLNWCHITRNSQKCWHHVGVSKTIASALRFLLGTLGSKISILLSVHLHWRVSFILTVSLGCKWGHTNDGQCRAGYIALPDGHRRNDAMVIAIGLWQACGPCCLGPFLYDTTWSSYLFQLVVNGDPSGWGVANHWQPSVYRPGLAWIRLLTIH